MHRGYIKIWRKVKDSGLFQLPNALTLFLYMLTEAAYKPIRFGTVDIDRGELCTGRHKLSNELGMSEQAIRTALDHLHKLEMITSKSTNKYTVYAIVNYGQYQDCEFQNNQQDNQQTTSEQPAINQQTTTNKERKKERKKDILFENSNVIEVLEYLNEKAGRNYKPVEANAKFIISRLNEGATVDDMKRVVDLKVKEWGSDSTMNKYLRPATLFNAEKFAQYSGETVKTLPVGQFDVNEWLKTK